MKILKERVFEGKNIYSHKKCIRVDVDLEGYSEIPSKDIPNFNYNLLKMLPELYTHRCGIDEEHGFVTRLQEGTYLAHICEHVAIAIQNKVGIDVAYGKAREIEGDFYYMIVQYEYPKLGIAAIKLSLDLINSLIRQRPIDFKRRLAVLERILTEEAIGSSTEAICNAAKQMGLPITRLGEGHFYQIGYGKQGRIIEATIGSKTTCVGADISCDKLMTKKLLETLMIPISEGEKVSSVIDAINRGEKIGYPLVLKPQYGNKGNGVILNIKSKIELIAAYNRISKKYKDIIVEKFIEGNDYRVLVINNKVVAAANRMPPKIIGDGESTINELINLENHDERRGFDHEKSLTKIKVDNELIVNLKKKGYDLNSILEKGEKLYLRSNSNLSTGGISIDCTDKVSDDIKNICIRSAKVLGLDICGVDICTKDIRKPLKGNGVVVEVNAAPGIRMHTEPYIGVKRNIGKEIVNLLYNENPENIPTISVTGTNGKTTTVKLISYIYSLIGYKVGYTTTEGTVIGKEVIDKGDNSGFYSAKSILLNPEVDVAVLETARGGLIKNGLAYENSDIGILTNISEDHLELDGINTLEQLAFVKSLVLESIKDGGYAVINADDKNSLKLLERIKAKKIFFSMNKNNKFIQKSVKNNHIAVYINNNDLCVWNRGKENKVMPVKEIGITINGVLKYNIYNAMAACAALVGRNIDYCIIRKGLKEFKSNSEYNPGRFNIFHINNRTIVLDYGHNIEGYKAVINSLKGFKAKKYYGVIGVPGDRPDYMVKEIGKLCSEFFDNIIIKEDIDKRGRKEGEIARILHESIKKDNKEIVLDEVEALDVAFRKSNEGDLIIIFYENLERINNYINSINEFQSKKKRMIN